MQRFAQRHTPKNQHFAYKSCGLGQARAKPSLRALAWPGVLERQSRGVQAKPGRNTTMDGTTIIVVLARTAIALNIKLLVANWVDSGLLARNARPFCTPLDIRAPRGLH